MSLLLGFMLSVGIVTQAKLILWDQSIPNLLWTSCLPVSLTTVGSCDGWMDVLPLLFLLSHLLYFFIAPTLETWGGSWY